MLLIGCHVHFNSTQLLGCVKETISHGANTFMIYTGAPQNTRRADINDEYTNEAKQLMLENNIDINKIICHSPYIVNLANHIDTIKHQFAITFIQEELKRCDQMGIKILVFHPGNAVDMTRQEGLDNVISGINSILTNDYICNLAIETMAGKGTELCINIDEIKYILDHVSKKNKVFVCLDTCHLNDSGVDVSKFDEYLDELALKIGIDKIKCVHTNDSKNELGSHKDRHENIGYGSIGFQTMLNVFYNSRLESIPKILETPYINGHEPYKMEIEMIKEKVFNPNIKD